MHSGHIPLTGSVILEQNAAYLILRGLKTLDLRVRQQNNTAMLLASFLESHPKVRNLEDTLHAH